MKLTKQLRRFIADQLSNAENSSDQELRDHFVSEGIDPETADLAIKDRSFWANNIVLSDEWSPGVRPEVYKPEL